MSCATCVFLGSSRSLLSCCKGCSVQIHTVVVTGSSPVAPTIVFWGDKMMAGWFRGNFARVLSGAHGRAQHEQAAGVRKSIDLSCAPRSETPRKPFARCMGWVRWLTKSGDNKGTIRGDTWYIVVSTDVRQHRLISISYMSLLPCHGRGRGFESRRPRHHSDDLTEWWLPYINTSLFSFRFWRSRPHDHQRDDAHDESC